MAAAGDIIVNFMVIGHPQKRPMALSPNDTLSRATAELFADNVAHGDRLTYIYLGRRVSDRAPVSEIPNLTDKAVIHVHIVEEVNPPAYNDYNHHEQQQNSDFSRNSSAVHSSNSSGRPMGPAALAAAIAARPYAGDSDNADIDINAARASASRRRRRNGAEGDDSGDDDNVAPVDPAYPDRYHHYLSRNAVPASDSSNASASAAAAAVAAAAADAGDLASDSNSAAVAAALAGDGLRQRHGLSNGAAAMSAAQPSLGMAAAAAHARAAAAAIAASGAPRAGVNGSNRVVSHSMPAPAPAPASAPALGPAAVPFPVAGGGGAAAARAAVSSNPVSRAYRSAGARLARLAERPQSLFPVLTCAALALMWALWAAAPELVAPPAAGLLGVLSLAAVVSGHCARACAVLAGAEREEDGEEGARQREREWRRQRDAQQQWERERRQHLDARARRQQQANDAVEGQPAAAGEGASFAPPGEGAEGNEDEDELARAQRAQALAEARENAEAAEEQGLGHEEWGAGRERPPMDGLGGIQEAWHMFMQ